MASGGNSATDLPKPKGESGGGDPKKPAVKLADFKSLLNPPFIVSLLGIFQMNYTSRAVYKSFSVLYWRSCKCALVVKSPCPSPEVKVSMLWLIREESWEEVTLGKL